MFFLQQISGFTEIFVLNDLVYSGQIWRLVSSMFLHGGMAHLFYNLFALLLFGFILEKLIGSQKFLIVFFVSGIISNLIAVNFYDSSLGASGAIYGVLGCIIILRPMMLIWAFGIMMPMFVAGILWIIGDIMGIFGFGREGIGNIAHLSGMGFGLIYGIWLRAFVSRVFHKNEKFDIPEEYIDEWERKYMGK